MTTFIALDATQAQKLRGITSPGHALDPLGLADGVTFILPLEVLDDPAHAEALANFALGKIDVLDAKQAPAETDAKAEDTYAKLDVTDKALQRDVAPSEFKVVEETPVKAARPVDVVKG